MANNTLPPLVAFSLPPQFSAVVVPFPRPGWHYAWAALNDRIPGGRRDALSRGGVLVDPKEGAEVMGTGEEYANGGFLDKSQGIVTNGDTVLVRFRVEQYNLQRAGCESVFSGTYKAIGEQALDETLRQHGAILPQANDGDMQLSQEAR